MMHRNEIQTPILSINMRNKLTNLALQLRAVSQSRRCHLDQNNIPDPFRIILEQLLEGTELLAISDKESIMISTSSFGCFLSLLDASNDLPLNTALLLIKAP